MGKVMSILWVDRLTARGVINKAAGADLYDPPALVRERGRAPTPQAADGAIRYSRPACESFGQHLAERADDGGIQDAS